MATRNRVAVTRRPISARSARAVRITAGPGLIAIGAIGAALLIVALFDVFMTIFNYDGFTFLAARFHRVLWRTLRLGTAWLPDRPRHAMLSLGSAAMLPATLALWLALEISGFAMMFLRFEQADGSATGFAELRERAREAARLSPDDYGETASEAYDQYQEWLGFHHRNRVFLDRLSEALGYAKP